MDIVLTIHRLIFFSSGVIQLDLTPPSIICSTLLVQLDIWIYQVNKEMFSSRTENYYPIYIGSGFTQKINGRLKSNGEGTKLIRFWPAEKWFEPTDKHYNPHPSIG